MGSPEPLLSDLGRVSALTGIPRRSLERYASQGRLGPEPIRLGVRRLYRTGEVLEWVEAGCPDRQTWRAAKGQK